MVKLKFQKVILNLKTFFNPEEMFVSFPCDECKENVDVESKILSGQAVVIECWNCKTSWTIYSPPLVIKKTKGIPEDIQKVWAELANG